MSLTGEPIIILGVFRSGTSALSATLEQLGAFLGQANDFFPPNENNLGGYWEIRDQQELNLRGYAVFGMNFYQVDRLPEDWRENPAATTYVNELRALLNAKFSGQAQWGWKEPGTTGLVPIYKDALAAEGITPRYAICVRHPLSVAASQIARQTKWGLDGPQGVRNLHPPIGEHTVGLWIHYTLSALRETKGSPRVVVSYEGFLENPARTIEQITNTLVSWKPSPEQTAAAIATVKPEWSHNRYTLDDLKTWPAVVGKTYDVALRAANDTAGLNQGRFDEEVDALWNEWGRMSKMARPILLPAGQLIFSWREGPASNSYIEKYSPTGTWQSFRAPIAAPAGSEIFVDPYQTPCHVWIRKAIWHTAEGERKAILNPGPNGVIEEAFGMKRLTIFGPNPLILQAPGGGATAELELEMMIQSSPTVLTHAVSMLKGRLDQVRRTAAPQQMPMGRR
ncbi:MAG: hypothetical protein QOJ65_965 [Fimbriimonadaceae bacterium]|jgi:hypothetical protein|nr:hypothetical protein [Fimbriimonadaceae bacterium]